MTFKLKYVSIFFLLFLSIGIMFALSNDVESNTKKLDLSKTHSVGNIWLRVSNYGYFGEGAGDDRWPSLEYPGGSSIDYLYKGALWFGAKKYRRSNTGERLFYKYPIGSPQFNADSTLVEGSEEYQAWIAAGHEAYAIVDTLVTVGFDGDADLYEFLPAYNPIEAGALGAIYNDYNRVDTILVASSRTQKRGVDDDGDGYIDEDPVGFNFPFRNADELPTVYQDYASDFLINTERENGTSAIINNYQNWFPLGFQDLSYEDPTGNYIFSLQYDDDNDGLSDEDGFPVSEQDFIAYYYDYSPFGISGQRDNGTSKSSNDHIPLNIRVRQMSYQWSYEYIKNLIYIEFDITNMNAQDTLYDCAMGVYMDSDVGPQSWDGDQRSMDDISSYNPELEFAYTYDEDQDGGLTKGYVGSRVCTPDPDSLEFACWYWNRGDGPDDAHPTDIVSNGTSNEKYHLLTGRNYFNQDDYISLREQPNAQVGNPDDTRYLFAFYGDMNGLTSPTSGSWNLAPGRTMKIVIAIFPGETVAELNATATWAKVIYGTPQNLETVVLPDTVSHYNPPEPPLIPKAYAIPVNKGEDIEVYWDNRSEFSIDPLNVNIKFIGWQDTDPSLDSYVGNYDPATYPEEFSPAVFNEGEYKANALVNPWTGFRLRHDFQGYRLWHRSNSGERLDWVLDNTWDKVDTEVDLNDYYGEDYNYGGELGSDKGLPNPRIATEEDTTYYRIDENYSFSKIQVGDQIYGEPIYNSAVGNPSDFADLVARAEEIELKYLSGANLYDADFMKLYKQEVALLFKNPSLPDEVYLSLYDESLIPVKYMSGQSTAYQSMSFGGTYVLYDEPELSQRLNELKTERLARRYYHSLISNPRKGVELYVAVTAYDRGIPGQDLKSLETGRDADANMKVFIPGPTANESMDNIYVVPNPYIGLSEFDGRVDNDPNGEKSRRIWFVGLPEKCTIRIYTLAGDLVQTIKHDGKYYAPIINVSKAANLGLTSGGIHHWNLLSKNNQIVASGVYLFSVEKDNGDIKVGKFVLVK